MTFATAYLEIEKEDAHEHIMKSVEGLRSKTVDDSIEYRNASGMLLAILSETDEVTGANTKLRYQISVIAPFLAHGRVKAEEIRAAVDEYRVEG
ncbi:MULTISPECIES: hypothetical protein [unclassified Haladaptatus]|uniref:hypothetical protein n=1 Tax=unclassified Haladaptatus TaxID=2622732 RepID=UPI00209C52DD|nr:MULTISPECIES: hypothetical protein [unclassified Haladaptatus]MCO8243284.1 hypothetical protein [Haladaptatus sp. AB643]MCO8252995.1 hypothetical protein [Haladaptatus sp. AB618]